MIWWIWNTYEYDEDIIHTFDVVAQWLYGGDEPDIYWLGECAWTCITDNSGIGLK